MGKKTPGQMMIEVMVGFAVAVVGVMAILQLANKSVGNAGAAEREALATRYANEGLDWVKGQVVALGWTTFLWRANPAPFPPALYCINDLTWTAGGTCMPGTTINQTEFTRNMGMISYMEGGKWLVNAQISVSWTEAQRTARVLREYEFAPY